MRELRVRFLSKEDLDLRHWAWKSLVAHGNTWLLVAQATNEYDKHPYSHRDFGAEFVFDEE